MANVLVRNVSDQTLQHLKAQALAHGRSLQAEAKAILEREADLVDRLSLVQELRVFRKTMSNVPVSDSTKELRKLRQEGHR